MKAFRKLQTYDRNLDQVQTHIAEVLTPLSKNKLIDGVLLEGIQLAVGTNQVSHTLRRQPLGWFIVDTTAASTVTRADWNSTILTLNATAATTVSLWVF